MFKISTKGDYGLLLMSALAEKIKEGRTYVSLREIAVAKKLSPPYLSQIILPLKKAGLVKSKEGRDGGYALARPAEKITMMEVLEVLEGPVSPVRCCGNTKARCGSESHCQVKFAWREAKVLLAQFLKTKTLEDTLPRSP